MNKLAIGSWLLSLTTDPARATTTVGDFAEESPTHSPSWFWRQIAATVLAHVRDDIAAAPVRLVAGAVLGTVVGYLSLIPLAFASIPFIIYWPKFDLLYAVVPFVLVTQFLIGRWSAWFTGRPLASWVAYVFLSWLLWFSVAWMMQTGEDVRSSYGDFGLTVLAGAICQRRRSLRVA